MTAEDSRPLEQAAGCGALGCSVLLAGGVLTPAAMGLVWVVDRVTRDAPPPFDRDEVVAVSKKPTSFDTEVSPYEHERPPGRNERLGINDVKDEIHQDFYPRLGKAGAEVTVDCGDAELADGRFECVARHGELKAPYRVRISGLNVLRPPAAPGTADAGRGGRGAAGAARATWRQQVTPKKAPLFRAAVHARLWTKAHVHDGDKAADLACDPLPEVALLAPGTVTDHRCYYSYQLGAKRRWATYRVALDAGGAPSLEPVRETATG